MLRPYPVARSNCRTTSRGAERAPSTGARGDVKLPLERGGAEHAGRVFGSHCFKAEEDECVVVPECLLERFGAGDEFVLASEESLGREVEADSGCDYGCEPREKHYDEEACRRAALQKPRKPSKHTRCSPVDHFVRNGPMVLRWPDTGCEGERVATFVLETTCESAAPIFEENPCAGVFTVVVDDYRTQARFHTYAPARVVLLPFASFWRFRSDATVWQAPW